MAGSIDVFIYTGPRKEKFKMNYTGKLARYYRLVAAKVKLELCRSIMNKALPEVIGNNSGFTQEFINVQNAFDSWVSIASQQIAQLEKDICENPADDE